MIYNGQYPYFFDCYTRYRDEVLKGRAAARNVVLLSASYDREIRYSHPKRTTTLEEVTVYCIDDVCNVMIP
jgi:hypothetical protein